MKKRNLGLCFICYKFDGKIVKNVDDWSQGTFLFDYYFALLKYIKIWPLEGYSQYAETQ